MSTASVSSYSPSEVVGWASAVKMSRSFSCPVCAVVELPPELDRHPVLVDVDVRGKEVE